MRLVTQGIIPEFSLQLNWIEEPGYPDWPPLD